MGELAVRADHEAGEGVGRIEARRLDALVERLAFESSRLGRAGWEWRVFRVAGSQIVRAGDVLADDDPDYPDLVENPGHRHRELGQVIRLDPDLVDFPGHGDRGDVVLHA